MKRKLLFIILPLILIVGVLLIVSSGDDGPLNTTELPPLEGESSMSSQYLAFQIFTGSFEPTEMRQSIPPPSEDIAHTVDSIIRKIGTVGSKNRKLAFIPGPLTFDNDDDQIRELIRNSFAIAIEKNIAVGFHLDDSMFWGRLSHLNKIENIEWTDWNKMPNTGRRLDWSTTPTKIMPQLCINSPTVKEEVKKRAILIGDEVKKGLETLLATDKAHLFAGIIAGWETQIGRDFETGKYLGYCALTNKGYSASNPPKNINEARADIIKEFIDLWAKSLVDGGVASEKIFSHIAFTSKSVFDSVKFSEPGQFPDSYLETVNFSPPRVAFGPHHNPGFSTYPQPGTLEQIQEEREKNSNPPWASAEGTAIDPGAAEQGGAGVAMEGYLGSLYNHGAVLVDIFGWGVGPSSNPFRKIAESKKAITAYQKFLHGEKLKEGEKQQVPSQQFFEKMNKLQKELPVYIKSNGEKKIKTLYETLNEHLGAKRFNDAEKAIDDLLNAIR
ncbi:MAG: YlbF family regulator [bacterium]|nr:YlbF family regulator [bacterium]